MERRCNTCKNNKPECNDCHSYELWVPGGPKCGNCEHRYNTDICKYCKSSDMHKLDEEVVEVDNNADVIAEAIEQCEKIEMEIARLKNIFYTVKGNN